MANPASLNVKVKRTGRVKPANLADPQLKAVGEEMVAAQKLRWGKAINAEGNAAKKLSVKYFFIKRKLRGVGRPVRDMNLSGQTIANFSLRKAAVGQIRAENSTRITRKRAMGAQNVDPMIGFAGTDQISLFKASQLQYGIYLQKAWVPIG
jgi:hypothetical protein